MHVVEGVGVQGMMHRVQGMHHATLPVCLPLRVSFCRVAKCICITIFDVDGTPEARGQVVVKVAVVEHWCPSAAGSGFVRGVICSGKRVVKAGHDQDKQNTRFERRAQAASGHTTTHKSTPFADNFENIAVFLNSRTGRRVSAGFINLTHTRRANVAEHEGASIFCHAISYRKSIDVHLCQHTHRTHTYPHRLALTHSTPSRACT